MGFTHEVTLAEMVDLGRRYGLTVVEDLGSGCLVDLSRYGLEREPTVQETLKAGADLVLFSGDKLLGGPQAGLILGNREVVEALRKNPMTRALRPDKMTLAALEATLRLYLEEPRALAEIPTLQDVDPAGGGVGPRRPAPWPGGCGAASEPASRWKWWRAKAGPGAGLCPRPPCPAGP